MSNFDPEYEKIVEWAKENPTAEQGMMVAVYRANYERDFAGYGIIASHGRWSEWEEDYLFDVEMEYGSFRQNVPSRHMDRVQFKGRLLRSWLKEGLVIGGKC